MRPSFTENTRIIDFLDYSEAVDILEKFAPGITKPPGIFTTKGRSLKELVELQEANLTVDKVKAIIEELNKLELEAVLVH
jgi:alpha-L-rhamnosidase